MRLLLVHVSMFLFNVLAMWLLVCRWSGQIIFHCALYTSMVSLPNYLKLCSRYVHTSRPRQDGRHFADEILRCYFLNENVWIPIKISLKFAPKSPINNIPTLVQIMAWRRPGDKPLSEAIMVSLPTHICVTWPQWVNLLTETEWSKYKPVNLAVIV